MYLLDTDVVSELRKGRSGNAGVRTFMSAVSGTDLYLSVITLGELRRGVERIRWRGDATQSGMLETWLETLLESFSQQLLPFDADCAHVWGRMRVPHEENAIDKQIAATAWVNNLTLVTRNVRHHAGTGVTVENPFV